MLLHPCIIVLEMIVLEHYGPLVQQLRSTGKLYGLNVVHKRVPKVIVQSFFAAVVSIRFHD